MDKTLVLIDLDSLDPFLKLRDPTDIRIVSLTRIGRDYIVNDAGELARLIGVVVPESIGNSYELDKVVDDFQIRMEEHELPPVMGQYTASLDADGFVHGITMFFKLPNSGDQERFLLVHYNPHYE